MPGICIDANDVDTIMQNFQNEQEEKFDSSHDELIFTFNY